MLNDSPLPRPRGFGLCARIVYVHQAICLAIFVAGLRSDPSRGIAELLLPHLLGIVISAAVLVAMFGVATRHSCKALLWLRLILWIGVVKILVVQLWLLSQGATPLASAIHTILINEVVAIPLALYWTRPVHVSYLMSLQRSRG